MRLSIVSILGIAASASLFTLTGCSGSASHDAPGGSASAASSADSSSFCDSYCTKNATCDSRLDAQTCRTKCDDEVSTSLKRHRSDVVAGAARCFEASDCRQILGGSQLGECMKEAAVSVAPAQTVKDFCDGLGKAFDRCDSHIDRADCLGSMKTYSDSTLAHGTSCLEKSCSQMASCVSATFGLSK